MAELLEFSTLHYNRERFSEIQDVLCPPSFSLSKREIEEFKKKSSYNYANLLFPDGSEGESYRNQKRMLFGWLLRDVLLVDSEKAFYLYEQEFIFENQQYRRYGLISLLKLDEVEKNIFSFEKVPESLVESHFHSFKEAESGFENVVFIYKNREERVREKLTALASEENLILEGKDSLNGSYRLYREKDPAKISEIKGLFSQVSLYVVGGSANVDAALRYRDEKREELGQAYTGEEPFNYLMGVLIDAEDPAFKMVPVHRLIKKEAFDPRVFLKEVQKSFKLAAIEITEDIRVVRAARMKLKKLLRSYKAQGKFAFGLYFKRVPSKYFVLILKDELQASVKGEFSAHVLNRLLLKPLLEIDDEGESDTLFYHQNEDWVLESVRQGEFELAFILGESDSELYMKDTAHRLPVRMMEIYPWVLSGITAYSWKYSKN